MAELKATIFNVDRGLCVFLRTPNNYGVLIDCGRRDDFSPVRWIYDHEAGTLQPWNGQSLAYLIITHPHDVHVEDIQNLTKLLPPAILNREKNYDWNLILNPTIGESSENVTQYYEWQQTYNQPVQEYPEYGVELQTFNLLPSEAANIDTNPQHLLNNTSKVTVVAYSIGQNTWKLVIAGDNETKGWEKLLEKDSFRDSIKGTSFFVTSHHGHTSGFCSELFDVMGKPYLNISSEKSGDESVCDNYRNYATGLNVGGQKRFHLTTRKDGFITIHMKSDWSYDIDCSDI